jgi:multicomponent Na+:H+ antiporter subunit D
MTELTIIWILLPLFLGMGSYLLPKFDRHLTLIAVLSSLAYSVQALFTNTVTTLELLDHFGVMLVVDKLSGFFILTNALVTAAVLAYCWLLSKSSFFYAQLLIVHGSLNAIFVSADFISVYVGLETIGIAAFLLVSYARTDRTIWVSLRYLFVSSVAMLFYLMGAVLVYKANHSFAFAGLLNAPLEGIALIILGLLIKGGVFVSGLWLPLTHAEAETPVSAMLSGVVVKAGIFPLVRLSLVAESVSPLIQLLGMASAFLGVTYALFESDLKRLLAWSTVSQVGFILVAPGVAGFYALAHGLAKASLFLTAGNLPERQLPKLQAMVLPGRIWIVLTVAALSISGFPLLAGYGAKVSALEQLTGWQNWAMNGAALGTILVFARVIFMPFTWGTTATMPLGQGVTRGFWIGVMVLLVGLVVANGFYYPAYTFSKLFKTLLVILAGWLAFFLIFRRIQFHLPQILEQFEHLMGLMSLMLMLLFWGLWSWLAF